VPHRRVEAGECNAVVANRSVTYREVSSNPRSGWFNAAVDMSVDALGDEAAAVPVEG
jgi:hypothetical protein